MLAGGLPPVAPSTRTFLPATSTLNLDQTLKTKVVSVVAAQAPVGQAVMVLDVAHALGQRTQLVQVFHDGACRGWSRWCPHSSPAIKASRSSARAQSAS